MLKKNLSLVITVAIVIVVVAGVLLFASRGNGDMNMGGNMSGNGSQSQENASSSSDAEETDTIEITDFAYEPKDVKVKVGDTITWTNKDDVSHTVTTEGSPPEEIDSGLFGKDETFSFTFKKAGKYDYYCEPHPYMKGTVTVTE